VAGSANSWWGYSVAGSGSPSDSNRPAWVGRDRDVVPEVGHPGQVPEPRHHGVAGRWVIGRLDLLVAPRDLAAERETQVWTGTRGNRSTASGDRELGDPALGRAADLAAPTPRHSRR
jgi:hypothetical protein